MDYFNRPGPWDDKNLGSLMDANKAWAKKMTEKNPGFFEELKRGHAPKILWIGCSDARVPANEMIGEPPGSVFVHRNVANMVVNTDFNCLSVLQYAVDVLKVKHIVVCGHYDCGGVRAALEPVDHGSPLENWLRNIRDSYRLHNAELNAIDNLRDRQRRLVELNVIEQVLKAAFSCRCPFLIFGEACVAAMCCYSTVTVTAILYSPIAHTIVLHTVPEHLQDGRCTAAPHRVARPNWPTGVSSTAYSLCDQRCMQAIQWMHTTVPRVMGLICQVFAQFSKKYL
jgi:carbonic anhydrase